MKVTHYTEPDKYDQRPTHGTPVELPEHQGVVLVGQTLQDITNKAMRELHEITEEALRRGR